MQIEIKIDETCPELKVIIEADKMTDEVSDIVRKLSAEQSTAIAGFQGDEAEILEPENIYRIYAENGKVFAETGNGVYTIRFRLYEAEERLAGQSFVRISNSEIVNLKKAKGFDLSFAGTICVKLANGTAAYVSRRYVSKIKQILGI